MGAEQGTALARALREAISARFGPGRYDEPMSFFGSSHWRGSGRWHRGDATLVSAYSALHTGNRLLAFAFLPGAGLSVDRGTLDPDEWRGPIDRERYLHRAIELAGLGEEHRLSLLAVVASVHAWKQGRLADPGEHTPSQLVAVLQAWLAAAQGLDHRRRAAALRAADQALTLAQDAFGVAHPVKGKHARRALEGAGCGVHSLTARWCDGVYQ